MSLNEVKNKQKNSTVVTFILKTQIILWSDAENDAQNDAKLFKCLTVDVKVGEHKNRVIGDNTFEDIFKISNFRANSSDLSLLQLNVSSSLLIRNS